MDNLKTITIERLLRNLSPPFVFFEDAARYAQAQIKRPNARPQGGYILLDPEGMCRATYPLEGALEDLLPSDGVSMEAMGNRLLPQGYRYLGCCFCEVDRHAEIARLRPHWSAQSILLYQSVLSTKAFVMSNSLGLRFFTIGPQGSLVQFTPNVRPGYQPFSQKMHEQVRSSSRPVLPQSVEDYIQALMGVGDLMVVKTSGIWSGWRGPLTARWKAFAPDPAADTPVPFLSPVFPDSESALAFAHRLLLLNPTQAQVGFVLKLRITNRFVVSEPVAPGTRPFDPSCVFHKNAAGEWNLPLHSEFVGVYSLAPDQPAPPTAKEPWLYERCFSPRMLAEAQRLAHDFKLPHFAYYLSTFDGAQLRYVIADPQAEQPFYTSSASATQSLDNGMQADLDEGRLTPRSMVRQLCTAGQLWVLKTSALWDVAARVERDWQPYSRQYRPLLSPAFILADDAARFAHEQIGSRREPGYLGLILLRGDQRLVATQPQATQGERFDFSRHFPVSRSGLPVVLEEGCTLHGVYSSRKLDDGQQAREDDEALVAAQMFMDTDIHRALTMPGQLPIYLSGSADSLLAYHPYLPDVSERLRERAAPGDGGSRLSHELQDATLVPSDVVREMTQAGVLRVVVGNRVWGPPGQVQSDWSPADDFDLEQVPSQPQLGALHSSARAAVLAACAHWRNRYDLAPCGLGLVLKHRLRDEFVTTQTVAAHLLDPLLHASRYGAVILTDTFQVHAVYYSARGMPQGLMGADAWLARHFIGAADFYAALYDQQGVRRATSLKALPIFLSTLDGALLEYRTQEDPYPLFKGESGEVNEHVLPRKLALTLTPHSLVQQIANCGQLTVLSTSDCWDVPGPVEASWAACAQAARRLLGPVFVSQDDAARHALSLLGDKRDQVYGGLILRRTDGLFTVTVPLAVAVEDFAPGWVCLDEMVDKAQFLGGSTAVARYHSTVAIEPAFGLTDTQRAVYMSMFSTDFLGAVLKPPSVPHKHSLGREYLICADGALLSYTVNERALEQSLATQLVSPSSTHPKNNPLEQALRDYRLTPSEYVNRVARAGELNVVSGSALWGAPGRLKHWEPFTPSNAHQPVLIDSPCTPVFAQLTDVLHELHRLAGSRDTLAFGLLLKSRQAAHYLASVPQSAGEGVLTLDRVFIDGLAPYGYEVLGAYLCSPTPANINKKDLGVAHPHDLMRVVGLKGPNGRGNLPIYLGGGDGAWIRYETGNRSALSPWDNAQPLQGYRDERLVFGPLFSHPDDAARHALRRVSPYKEAVFVGLVLVDTAATLYVAVEPLKDEGIHSSVPQRLFLLEKTQQLPAPPAPSYPEGFHMQAVHLFFRTMLEAEGISASDKALAEHFVGQEELGFYRSLLRVSGVKGAFCYVSTRQGALLGYVPELTAREDDLFGHGIFGPARQRPNEWMARLATEGRLQVLDTDDYWTRSGVLEVDWKNIKLEPNWQVESDRPGKDEF